MKIVLITYEFTYSPFSGNGILARSIVKALLKLGCHLTVICRRPPIEQQENNINNGISLHHHNNHLEPPELTQEQAERLHLIDLPLSNKEKSQSWKRLDRGSAWEDFCYESFRSSEQGEADVMMALDQATVTMAVDWTGAHAWRSFPGQKKPFLYLNFRVYKSGVGSDSSSLNTNGGMETESNWYDEMEKKALMDADAVVALSTADRQSLLNLMSTTGGDERNNDVDILWPPLRGEVADLAATSSTPENDLDTHLPSALLGVDFSTYSRRFISCIVRLSPEKNAMWFVTRFLEAIKDQGEVNWMIPVLAGAASDKEYASQVRKTIRTVCPRAILLDDFLSPKALAALLSRTVLNVHPCKYDAYGMTILEAAAMGAPSLISSSGNVGATALLGDDDGRYLPCDIGSEDAHGVEQEIRELLRNTTKLEQVGQKAREKSLSWDEDAYGKQLLGLIEATVAEEEASRRKRGVSSEL